VNVAKWVSSQLPEETARVTRGPTLGVGNPPVRGPGAAVRLKTPSGALVDRRFPDSHGCQAGIQQRQDVIVARAGGRGPEHSPQRSVAAIAGRKPHGTKQPVSSWDGKRVEAVLDARDAARNLAVEPKVKRTAKSRRPKATTRSSTSRLEVATACADVAKALGVKDSSGVSHHLRSGRDPATRRA